MSSVTALKAEIRQNIGKGASRAARRSGRIPAVIYGGDKEPAHITLEPVQLDKELHQTGFFSKIFELPVGKTKERVLARDVQFHPVKDTPLHVDFMRISKGSKLQVSVPFKFINEDKSPGIKRGALLNVVLQSLNVSCSADDIPECIEVDLDGLNVHDSVHFTSITLPKGVVAVNPEHDNDIANIVPSTMMRGKSEDEASEGSEDESAE